MTATAYGQSHINCALRGLNYRECVSLLRQVYNNYNCHCNVDRVPVIRAVSVEHIVNIYIYSVFIGTADLYRIRPIVIRVVGS